MDEKEIKLKVKETIKSNVGEVLIYNIQKIRGLELGDPGKLPYSHRILLENILRNLDGKLVKIVKYPTFHQGCFCKTLQEFLL